MHLDRRADDALRRPLGKPQRRHGDQVVSGFAELVELRAQLAPQLPVRDRSSLGFPLSDADGTVQAAHDVGQPRGPEPRHQYPDDQPAGGGSVQPWRSSSDGRRRQPQPVSLGVWILQHAVQSRPPPSLRGRPNRIHHAAQRCPVTAFDGDAIHLLVSDMFDTMRAANGAGLAAPQIGVDLQLVIFGSEAPNPRYPDAPVVPRTVLLNPVITPIGDEEEEGWEGCLSVPGLRGLVPRWARIKYTGFDQYGDPIDRTVDGFHARVVQHECDHLIGKLYPMRVRDFSKFGFTEVLFPGLDAQDD